MNCSWKPCGCRSKALPLTQRPEAVALSLSQLIIECHHHMKVPAYALSYEVLVLCPDSTREEVTFDHAIPHASLMLLTFSGEFSICITLQQTQLVVQEYLRYHSMMTHHFFNWVISSQLWYSIQALLKPKESAERNQTSPHMWGLGTRLMKL